MTPKKRRIFFVLLLSLLIATTLWLVANKGNTAPNIKFTDIDNNQHALSDYKGKPLLLIFWATDCPGCIAEIPELLHLNQQYGSQGLAMVAIAMSHDSIDHIKTMRHQRQLPYTIVWDHDNSISTAFNQVRVTPTHFLIDKKGDIILRKIGALNTTLLHKKLQSMGLSPN